MERKARKAAAPQAALTEDLQRKARPPFFKGVAPKLGKREKDKGKRIKGKGKKEKEKGTRKKEEVEMSYSKYFLVLLVSQCIYVNH